MVHGDLLRFWWNFSVITISWGKKILKISASYHHWFSRYGFLKFSNFGPKRLQNNHLLFLEYDCRPFLVFRNFRMNVQSFSQVLAAILLFKKSCQNTFFFDVWRGKNQQSIKFISSHLWKCKVWMALYLEIKNGVFSGVICKICGFGNVHVIKICQKYHRLWLAENQCW